DRIDVTAGFHGDRIILFGVQKLPGDIIITVEGPPKTMRVRRKESVGGIWMNKAGLSFENVPGFYAYALSNPSIDPARLKDLKIGTQNQRFTPKEKGVEKNIIEEFQNGLIRN